MELPKRKPNRIKNYSYNTPNAYFITICTQNRYNYFWETVGATTGRPQDVPLSRYGRIVDAAIQEIPIHYPMVSVDHYVIMPNHVHLLLQISSDAGHSMIAPTEMVGRSMIAPTVSRIMKQMKGIVTKRAEISLWQKGFYDHVIRGDKDYLETWNYIDGNPGRWLEDDLYSE